MSVDLSTVSSVVSNVSASSDNSSSATAKSVPHQRVSSTKITIHGYISPAGASNGNKKSSGHSRNASRATQKEAIILTLRPMSPSVASEWLDGLLMLLNQQPITAETSKLIKLISDYGLKIRLLNVRFDDAVFAGEAPAVPSREGLTDDYYYDIFGGS